MDYSFAKWMCQDLKRLFCKNEAGYVKISETFKDNKPYTTVSITRGGTKALNNYLDEMENLIKALRN
jgi:hypothetical protein